MHVSYATEITDVVLSVFGFFVILGSYKAEYIA